MEQILISAFISAVLSLFIINHERIVAIFEDITFDIKEWLSKQKENKGRDDRTGHTNNDGDN